MSSVDCDLAPEDPLLASEHGTFFLDAVGRLSRDTQRMLLTCLVSCMNVPEEHDRPWVGRVVAGNGEHLMLAIEDGRFSEALFDSLDKVRVELGRPQQVRVA